MERKIVNLAIEKNRVPDISQSYQGDSNHQEIRDIAR